MHIRNLSIPILRITNYYALSSLHYIREGQKPNPYKQFSSVVCNSFAGSYMVTSHVLAYGHKKICYLSRFSYEKVSSICDRYEGYKKALEDHNGEAPRFVKIDSSLETSLDYPMLKHVINPLYQEGITSIICENDEVAFYVHMASRSLSLRPPEDLSIAGFDNIS